MKLLIIDNPDSWHVNDLHRAAGSAHHITTATYHDLVAAFTSNINERSSFIIAGQPISDYEAILTRAMPASSLEQIVFRMDALNQIEQQLGIPVINPARTIESSVDKYLSLELMRQMELPVPETHVSQTVEQAMTFFDEMGGQTVIKPIFGSQGRGLALARDPDTAEQHFSELQNAGRVIYQQRYIDHGGEDIRVLVNGGQTFAVKRKRHDHWITNASQGATCERHDLDPLEQELAMAVAHSQGAFLAGVDIAYESGMPYILEVNACPSWKHLSSALETDVSAAVLYMINRMAGYSDD